MNTLDHHFKNFRIETKFTLQPLHPTLKVKAILMANQGELQGDLGKPKNE
jgi:hypothetical protein